MSVAELVHRHRGLVRSLALRAALRWGRSSELEDLVAYGMVGLVEAAARFEAGRNVRFSTFAYRRVWGAIRDGRACLDAGAPDAEGHERRESEVEALVDPQTVQEVDAVARVRHRRRLAAALASLTAAERRLLEAHYAEDLSLAAAARRMGRSRAWGCRRHRSAIDKLSHLLEDLGRDLATGDRSRSAA